MCSTKGPLNMLAIVYVHLRDILLSRTNDIYLYWNIIRWSLHETRVPYAQIIVIRSKLSLELLLGHKWKTNFNLQPGMNSWFCISLTLCFEESYFMHHMCFVKLVNKQLHWLNVVGLTENFNLRREKLSMQRIIFVHHWSMLKRHIFNIWDYFLQ